MNPIVIRLEGRGVCPWPRARRGQVMTYGAATAVVMAAAEVVRSLRRESADGGGNRDMGCTSGFDLGRF
jgi:hypothetical protein